MTDPFPKFDPFGANDDDRSVERARLTIRIVIILAVLLALVLAVAPLWIPAHAAEPIKRSTTAKRQFQKLHACPSTGQHAGRCPGYVIDHIEPLCAGGADSPTNMQWQTVAAAREKDKLEVARCRAMRKGAR